MSLREIFTWGHFWAARFQVLGVTLLLLGLTTTVVLAAAASSGTPPDSAQSALFVLVSGVFNVGGVWASTKRPDAANLVASRIALRHLAKVGQASAEVKKNAEDAFDRSDPKAAHAALGYLSVQLSAIEQQLGSNLQDWLQAYPQLAPENVKPTERLDQEAETDNG